MVAVALGALIGALLTFISYRASSMVTPEDPGRGFAIVVLLMVARLVLVIALLAGYYFLAKSGLVMFSLALILAFIASLVFEAVKTSGPHASRTSG